MTRLLIGLRSGLFGFDTDGDDAPVQLFRGIQPLSVAVDPVEPARLYCASYDRGVWRSEDAGSTWLPIRGRGMCHSLRRALSPTFPAGELVFFIPWRVVAENPARRKTATLELTQSQAETLAASRQRGLRGSIVPDVRDPK
jgi:hypothetical protein